MSSPSQEQLTTATDITVGVGAASTIVWLDWINTAAQEIVLIGGAVLVLYRIGLVLYKFYKGKVDT